MENIIHIDSVIISNRIRKDLGDIQGLVNSIKEHGLIEPIVLKQVQENDLTHIELVAGERRLTALKKLGITQLVHAKHYIWRDDLRSDDPKIKLLAASIEMEENIRRKELSWVEQVTGKAKLLELMQSLHGPPIPGQPIPGQPRGFGVRSLAAMIGESPEQTSNDLDMAALITKIPSLAKELTREAAKRKITTAYIIAGMKPLASQAPPIGYSYTLHDGPFEDNISLVENESVDLIYTDLPYGVNLSQMDRHQGGISYIDTRDSIVSLLPKVAHESYRVLREDRFGVFFFGFNYYTELVLSMIDAGFKVNNVPVIWYKHTSSTENPNSRYANSYDQALVVMKGSPKFIRPGQSNLVDIKPEYSKVHIAQQPVPLVEKFLFDMTVKNATVVDLFAGSGTTGVACVKNLRQIIMFEKEPSAIITIRARMNSIRDINVKTP